MELKVIDYETAKLLSRTNFPLPDNNYNEPRYFCFEDGTRATDQDFMNDPHNPKFDKLQEISAPTQELLRKWLRDEHNIHIQIRACDMIDDSGSFESYEQALETGLKEVLKYLLNQRESLIMKKEDVKSTIAVDFDGVIHRYSKGWDDGTIYDEPMPGAKDKMEKLKEDGYTVIIYSSRAEDKIIEGVFQSGQIQDMTDWLNKYEIPYDRIESGKPLAIAYIDDRAVEFRNWEEAYQRIKTEFNYGS